MVLPKEDFLSRIKTMVGDKTDDDTLSFLEDATDTINSFGSDTEDWKTKYEELDKTWRDKYKARFFNKDESKDDFEESDGTKEVKTFDDLFKEEE